MKRPIQTWTGGAVAVVAGCLVIAVSAAQAGSSTISGVGPFTLTDDTELVGDIDCTGLSATDSAADCILFGTDEITLELNGFTITGPEPQLCTDAVGPDGVDTAGNPDAEIKGPGKVTRFNVGIHINGSDDSKVREVVAIRNCLNGILVNPSDNVEIRENIVLNTFNPPAACGGISIAGNDNRVRRNEVHDNGQGGGDYGIRILSGTGNKIEENAVTRNFSGIVLSPGSSNTEVDDNIALNNKGSTIDIADSGTANVVTADNVCEVGTGAAAAVCAVSPTPPFAIEHKVD